MKDEKSAVDTGTTYENDRYISPDDFDIKFDSLKQIYESIKNISLDEAKQPWIIFCFAGATNVKERKDNFAFIGQSSRFFAGKTQLNLSTSTPAQLKDHFQARIVKTVIAIYIKAQILATYKKPSLSLSKLVEIIDDTLQLNEHNKMDDETWAACLLETKKFFPVWVARQPKAMQKMNADFLNYVNKELGALESKHPQKYPITEAITPYIETAFGKIGYGTGYVIGETLSHTTALVPAKLKLIAYAGTGIAYITGYPAVIVAGLFAPHFVDKIVTSICSFTMADVTKYIAQNIGKGAGMSVGLTMDLSVKLVQYSIALIATGILNSNKPKMTGVRLLDFLRVENGVIIDAQFEKMINEVTEHADDIHVYKKENTCYIKIGEKEMVIAENHSDLINTLIQTIAAQKIEPTPTHVTVENPFF